MTKRYPVPYFVKKTLAKPGDNPEWEKGSKDTLPPKREEILEAIKKRVLAKKKKK